MAEAWWIAVFLSVLGVCAMIITLAVVIAVSDLRRTMRQVRTRLPHYDRALAEAHRTLTHLRRVLARTDHATRHVEGVVRKACGAAAEIIDRVVFLKEQAEDLWVRRFGNGTRAGPRSRFHR